MSAGDALAAAAVAALKAAPGLAALTNVFDAPPVRGALPYALVDDPVLADWSGAALIGREARLTVGLCDAGERPLRLRALVEAAEDAVAAIGPALGQGWRVASVTLLRGRVLRAGGGDRWVATSEFRVRMWRES